MSSSSKSSMKIPQLMKRAPERYHIEDYAKITLQQFQQLLPKTVPTVISEDIAYYFNYLRTNRNKKNLNDWEGATGCTDSPNSWKVEGYRPIFSFLYYDRITEGLFLPLLLEKIESTFSSQTKKMSIEEFNKLCRLSIVGFKPKIDSIDLKIIQTLSKQPSLVTQELTDAIAHSYATVYNHLQKLKAKMGLRVTTRVNWVELGVQRCFLISDNEEIFKEFSEFKIFQDGQASFLWGETFYLRYYFLKEEARQKIIQQYNKVKQKSKARIKYYELTAAPLSGYNFDLYNLDNQRWEFDFATTFIKPETIVKKRSGTKERELFTDIYPPDSPYELSEMEINIINGLVGSYTLSQKEIASQLGIHAPNLSIIKTKLLNDRIISPQLMIRTFLPLNCVLWCSAKDQEIIDTLIYLMQKIPYSSISPVESLEDPKILQLICFLVLDDILYSSLVTFLIELHKDNRLEDFRMGLIIDQYFSMANAENILHKEI
ncbi:MAG: winged helix-turn-helix transcriptional regulator [Candidatus Heimdallarchaeota archaeon]